MNKKNGSGGIRTHEAYASDLESLPFDRSGTLPLTIKVFTLCGTRTHNLQIRSLTRYPVAPIGLCCFLPKKDLMLEVGFEPTKRDASDLKSLPFDQTREP